MFLTLHLGTPAIYSSFKKCPKNCQRLQFYPHFFLWIKTANGGSSMDTCQNCKPWQFYGHFSEFMCIVSIQLQTLAVLWTLFGHFVSPWGFCMIQNCKRWQFYGHFSELWPKTANGGSFMDTFRSCGNPVTKLHFLKTPKSVHRTATVCSFGKCP